LLRFPDLVFGKRDGVTFEDPDGYRVVLQNGAWTL